MSETILCPECNASVPADAPQGLCPRCLMGAACSVTGAFLPADNPVGGTRGPSIVVDLPEFLRAIRELDLVPTDELTRLAEVADNDATQLARLLVQLKKLTAYQTGALLQGKARGLLIGQYLVQDRLGVGGMGVVFKAEHRPSGRLVALKILPPSFGRDGEAVRRFRREFQVASRLSHPNLVAAIEASEDRGVHYLTMDYIPGYNLDRLVSQGGPMALKLALHSVIQVARGLEAAHAQGVIHRDIKPGNIMIDPAGSVRVLDLGLARVIEATNGFGPSTAGTLTQTGSYMGTVDFIAPEQADNAKAADGRADIYSLACTLYFLLTGKPPFPGESILTRLIAHQHLPAPSLRLARPEVPESLEAIYLKMMAKRAADRPQAISEVVLALEVCRTSAREAGDASADLKTFAQTALKRAPARVRRGPENSVFARPMPNLGDPTFDPDLNLEDLITGYRNEAGHGPIPKEKLPPIALLPLPLHSRQRRSSAPYAWIGLFLVGLAFAGYVLWSRDTSVKTVRWVRPDPSPSQAVDDIPLPVRPTPFSPPEVATPPEVAATPEAPAIPAEVVAAPETAGVTLPPLAELSGGKSPILLTDDFNVPHVGWQVSKPEDAKSPNGGHGYAAGVWYCMSQGEAQFGWTVPGGPYPESETEVAVRVVGDKNADPQGGALISFFSDMPGKTGDKASRGFQIRINGFGRLLLEPSFFSAQNYPNGPWRGPITHPALKPAGQTNVLKFRVRKRQLEIFANGFRISEPIKFDWDLTPTSLCLGADSWSGIVRAEFDRIEIREFNPNAPQRPADAKEYLGKYYKVFSQELPWQQAKLKCQEMGGHLAIVTNDKESRFITALAKKQKLAEVWLGATDEQVESQWLWVDGSPMRYNNWDTVAKQPNNKQGLEHYLILLISSDGKWADQPNTAAPYHPGYVCQWD